MSSHTASGSTHITEMARSARLVLARATIPPNLSISGNFWNCGAPPDSEIAVAIVSAPSRQATSTAVNAAIQSAAPGWPANDPRLWKTTSVTVEMNAKLARLNATLTIDWREVTSIATPEPTRTARRYSSGVTKNSPRTAGISLREKECVSRRKWTRMTLVSTARKATARSGHGNENGLATG
jgi:hypothetical protein